MGRMGREEAVQTREEVQAEKKCTPGRSAHREEVQAEKKCPPENCKNGKQ